MFKSIFLTMICFLLMSHYSHAADTDKIAVIDFQQILTGSIKGKSVQNDINRKGAEIKALLDEAQTDIKKMQDQYKYEASLLSEEEKKQSIL